MFKYKQYPFVIPPELKQKAIGQREVTIIGAGPVGLTLALALAKNGIRVLLLEATDQLSVGSRAICLAKRSLEIFDKLGVAEPMMEKGVRWNVGRIFFRDEEIDCFDLSPEKISKYPAFINLQQYYVEEFLIREVLRNGFIEIRWLNKLVNLEKANMQKVRLAIETPEGNYSLETKWLAACDGCRSDVRSLLGLEMRGERFEERFLIADFKMEADFPSERWFWFDPPFALGQSILLHKQPDNIWRLDLKLGKNAHEGVAEDKEMISEKIKRVVGERSFELEWTSIYSFSSKMLERFVHDNIFFVGDAAHVVSPFGARGANSGIEDADNLAWKLAKVIQNSAPTELLETYNNERTAAAKQNITCTAESTLFIAPASDEALAFRNSILIAAKKSEKAKRQVNCGRLSVPSIYSTNAESEDEIWQSQELAVGRAAKDCKMESGFLIDRLGYDFCLLSLRESISNAQKLLLASTSVKLLEISPKDDEDIIKLYELTPGAAYLITPDGYVLGRWKNVLTQDVKQLVENYLSGQVKQKNQWQKSAQELIDEEVADKLRALQAEILFYTD
jgi:3-(3-hydroxy-phenyl)propionate hydroxylase